MFDDLLSLRPPPPNRVNGCDGDEQHLTEGAVMVAFAMHLFRTVPCLTHVAIHPDGEHGKRFEFVEWLGRRGFKRTSVLGKTLYGGVYTAEDGRTIEVSLRPGLGDVTAESEGRRYMAECKGGVIDTTHTGQKSRLRKGLYECVGLLMTVPREDGRRQFVVVPKTPEIERCAKKLAPRAAEAGIEIALVDGRGNVYPQTVE